MKKLLLVPLFALALGGCVTTGGGGVVVVDPVTPPVVTPFRISDLLALVQGTVSKICPHVVNPTVLDRVVLDLIDKYDGQSDILALVMQGAQTVCGALTPQEKTLVVQITRRAQVRYQRPVARLVY